MRPKTTVVLDNGASTIKVNSITEGALLKQPRIITNAIVSSKGDKKTYCGHEFAECRDHSSLHFRLPFEKGYLTDWDAQKTIWDGLVSEEVLGVDLPECSLLITEPYFNLPKIQDVYDQFAFEEYEFDSYFRCTPAYLIPHGALFGDGLAPPECMLIVDSGFSFTHVIPILNGQIVWKSVRRLDVGGKLLTNHLKELVSFRQWNMMDETYIVNEIKEACCYVSNDYNNDMEKSRQDPKGNENAQEYVLPNFSTNRQGCIRNRDDILAEDEQVLLMNSERFAVPEVLFRPTDIGMAQSGISATVADSVASLPIDVQGMFWANIGLIGGNTKLRGFRQRLLAELRCLAPVDYDINIYESSNPVIEAYLSGAALANSPSFHQHVVTRAEYNESGGNACRRKFADWKTPTRAAIDEDVEMADRVGGKDRSKMKGKARAKAAEEDAGKKVGRTRTRMR